MIMSCPSCGKSLSVSGFTRKVICSGFCGTIGYSFEGKIISGYEYDKIMRR